MRSFVTWVVLRRRLVVALVLLVTLALLVPLRNLEIIVDTDQLLPQEHPYVVATKTVERIFGSRYTVVVGMTPTQGDMLQPEMLAKLKGATDALGATPGARTCAASRRRRYATSWATPTACRPRPCSSACRRPRAISTRCAPRSPTTRSTTAC
jgi:uncharacterized membrane protein YdfJ with MMPL/SSD domain